MKILISGKPRSGKTTLVKKIASQFSKRASGFYTEEVIKNGTRVGFKAISFTDNCELVLAHVALHDKGKKVGKYGVNVSEFEAWVREVLGKVLEGPESLVIIDEIGKMELMSKGFEDLVMAILASERTVLATVKSGWGEDWKHRIKDKNVYHFSLKEDNFEEILYLVSALINSQIVQK